MSVDETLQAALADRYRIEREIGAGGMATVYLAHDVRHDRAVALKVLLPDLAAVIGAERFFNEINVTAHLQHPHILPLFDSGEVERQLFYVMPFIPGESLRERLQRERQLPVDEAIRIAREVASALDYAHRQGVLHRDIKPGNILLYEGQALVADFGIALALRRAGGDRITQTGLSLGTPEYMSPEQASGDRGLDARTDIYSLGAVLYEMLAGQPPYTGPTVQAIIAHALADPLRPVHELRDTAPIAVSQVVDRALAKLPADRFATAAEFAQVLGTAWQTSSAGAPVSGPFERRGRSGRRVGGWRSWRPYAAVGGALGLLAAGLLIGRSTAPMRTAPAVPAHFVIDLPARTDLRPEDLPAIAISPQGRDLAFVAESAGVRRIYVRDIDGLDFRALDGTEGAVGPFFSPDGASIGFFAGGRLAKIPVRGGAPTKLADAALARGASWGVNDTILFTSAPGTGLWEVAAGGGPARALTHLDASLGERTHRFPDVVDQDNAVLFTARRGTQATFDDAEIDIWQQRRRQRRLILQGGSQARYVPTGQIVFVRAGTLYGVSVNPRTLEPEGEPAVVLDSVMTDPSTGAAQFAFSRNGTLIYVRGDAWAARRQLELLAPGRQAQVLVRDGRPFRTPRFAPSAAQLAVVTESANDDIWVYDLISGTFRRVTFANGSNVSPVWSPDGKQLVFSSNRAGRYNLYRKVVVGQGGAERLTTSENIQFATSWRPDGGVVAYTEFDPHTGADIWMMDPRKPDSAEAFLRTPANEFGAAFSPDGKWVAYVSDESGENQVYLQEYPGGGGKEQVSVHGGSQVVWAPQGGTLFYLQGQSILGVTVTTTPSLRISRPRLAYHGDFDEGSIASVASYDVDPRGRGFLVAGPDESRPPTRIHVIVNWFSELAERMAGRQ